jgi:2-haloacid dehalogenase
MTGAGQRPREPVDAVVFDLGGVLVRWDPRRLYRRLLPDAEVEAFLAEIDFAAWNSHQDAGRTFAEGIEAHARLFPHRRELLAAYPERFAESLDGTVPGSVELLTELSAAGVRLLALTNWSAQTWPVAEATYPFLGLFEAVIVSGREGVAKPDPAIFELLITRHRLDPARTVFVDDAPANVAAAAASGLVARLFTGAAALRADLVRLGLLPGPPGGSP